jgi:hypothetical protein
MVEMGNWYLYIRYIFICLVSNSIGQLKDKKIILLRVKCYAANKCIECVIDKFECDSNIYIQKKEGKYATLRSDTDVQCFDVDLFLYKHKISLDSLYYASIKNKDLQYIGGFMEGDYLKERNHVSISLTFLNAAINTSSSTEHSFKLIYNILTNEIEQALSRRQHIGNGISACARFICNSNMF